MLNNKDLRCLPRAEINNSLTREAGKGAIRDCGSGSGWWREPGVGAQLRGWKQPWEDSAMGSWGDLEGRDGGAGEGRGQAKAIERERLCDQMGLGSHRLLLLCSWPWTSFLSQLWSL